MNLLHSPQYLSLLKFLATILLTFSFLTFVVSVIVMLPWDKYRSGVAPEIWNQPMAFIIIINIENHFSTPFFNSLISASANDIADNTQNSAKVLPFASSPKL